MERPTKRRKTGKQPVNRKEATADIQWPEYFNELFKVFKAINTVLGFISTRKQLATTFDMVRSSVENLTKKPLDLEQIAELKALLPDVVKFAYIPQNQLQVHASPPAKRRSNSPDFGLATTPPIARTSTVVDSDEHVLILDFADGARRAKTQNMGLLPAPSLNPQAVKKLIEKRNEMFQRAVDEFIKSTLGPDAALDDAVKFLRTASLAHVPVNPCRSQLHSDATKAEETAAQIDPSAGRSELMISTLQTQPWYRDQIVDKRTFPLKAEETALLFPPLSETIAAALWDSRKITKLYAHQVEAIQAISQQKHVIVSTSTASGKSVIYQIPILRFLEEDLESTAFFIYPTKALAQDQKSALEQLIGSCASVQYHQVATYDGDTPTEHRTALREQSSVIFTNFDMLHVAILPHEELWRRFFKNLKLVVIDELHYYSGLFGSHVAQIIRRLRRICAAVGNQTVRIISCSATISNPQEHMSKITGVPQEDIKAVTHDGAPAGRKDFLVWNPAYIDPMAPELGRHSSLNDAVSIMKFLMKNGMKVILFCKIRKVCELTMKTLRAELSNEGLYDVLEKTMPYRGGYSPEDRRRIEADAFNGRLLGIVSTNALELGVDIGILDAVVMLGFPMTLASFRQQAGRAGRRAQDSIAILVADSFPVDQYFAKNPNELFDAPYDDLVIDLENKHLLEGHLQCAAHEMPVSSDDGSYFGPLTKEICQTSLVQDAEGWYHTNPKFLPTPAHHISIRGVLEEKYVVVNVTKSGHAGTILEEVEVSRAMFEVYEGGVFMHQGIPFIIKELSHETKLAKAIQADVNWITSPRDFTNIDAIETYRIKEIKNSPNHAYFGQVDIMTRVFGFFKVRNKTILDSVDLESPTWEQTTSGFWLDLSEPLLSLFRQKRINPAEAVHAAQHAVLNRFSLAQDLRTECKVAEKEYRATESARKRPARLIFYDAVGKGGGVASKAFDNVNLLLAKACHKIEACECEAGCKDCVQSLTCKEANLVSSKIGALIILKDLLGQKIDPDAIPVREDKINYPETVVPATEIKALSNIRVELA